MEDKVGLTLACLNIKKLVKMMVGKTRYFIQIPQYYWIMGELSVNIKKDKHQKRCLSSLASLLNKDFIFYNSSQVLSPHGSSSKSISIDIYLSDILPVITDESPLLRILFTNSMSSFFLVYPSNKFE